MQPEIIQLTKLATRRQAAFGEFLVEHNALDRFQLFRVLQMQDRVPEARLGQCAVALGYVPRDEVERLHVHFMRSHRDIELDALTTEAFHREPEIEILDDGEARR